MTHVVAPGRRTLNDSVRTLFRLLRMFLVTGIAGALIAATVVGVSPQVYRALNSTSSVDSEIDLNALDSYAVRSYMYAGDGSLLATLHGAENRVPVTIDRIPQVVRDAVLSVEDADYYNHPGVNMRGIFRAMVENVSSGGKIEQGGSTITQQLVKKTFVGDELTADRKASEMAMALRLEKKLSKDQILEKYLNTVYFGSGAYGVQAAAETYWGVDVGFLGPSESAMLAALIRSPVDNDPTLQKGMPDEQKRAWPARKQALERMVVNKKITKEQAAEANRVKLPSQRCGQEGSNPAFCAGLQPPPARDHFEDEVRQRLLNDPKYGLGATSEERERTLFGGGIRVFTTVNPVAQRLLRDTYNRIVPKDEFEVLNPDGDPANPVKEKLPLTAAMVSVEPGTGAVRGIMGGEPFDTNKYNNAFGENGRQTGSSFKTFVLLAALEQGNGPNDYVAGGGDFPNPGGDPNPYQIEGQGGSLDAVTTQSSNGAFVRLGQIVGIPEVVRTAESLGLTTDFKDLPISMPLGVLDTKPVEMAAAYNALPSGGIFEPYYLIDKVLDRNGMPIYEHFSTGRRAVSAESACLATQILNHNTEYGTGRRAAFGRQPVAGKTGTSDGAADVWFVGFTPYLTTSVWMGFQKFKAKIPSIDGIANMGGFFPARMWGDFNSNYHKEMNLAPQSFARCNGNGSGRQVVGPGSNNKNLPAPGNDNRTRNTTAPTPTAPPVTVKPLPTLPPVTIDPTPTITPPPTVSTPPTITTPPTVTTPPTSSPPPAGVP